MGRIAKFCAALGVLVPLGVALVSGILWASDDGTGQGHFAGMFMLVVIGIPALGFGLLMLLVGAVTGGIAAAEAAPSSAAPSPNVRGARTTSTHAPRHGSAAPSGWPTPSWYILVPALLWSVPLGFLTFVCSITGETEESYRYAFYWLAPIAAAYGLQVAFTRRAV
ncbi:MAG: hypothetical protein AAFP28_06940 [Pseudomonadota bacterium]